ncbi:hypothetical protein BLNAU_9339 [Blattamonas nauphoetae]|uniref:Uncharacterized protein n=1 Tax=Blattamonas nauphoetae TaxID=2049346 RepID=A0ABQ9XVY8_9EUKA|nr:hypothetical protein BLNAU_9339 [Blattamonas nauphoetae]
MKYSDTKDGIEHAPTENLEATIEKTAASSAEDPERECLEDTETGLLLSSLMIVLSLFQVSDLPANPLTLQSNPPPDPCDKLMDGDEFEQAIGSPRREFTFAQECALFPCSVSCPECGKFFSTLQNNRLDTESRNFSCANGLPRIRISVTDKTILQNSKLQIQTILKCVSTSTDGASSMRGEGKGFLGAIRREGFSGIHIHCQIHKVQLSLLHVLQKRNHRPFRSGVKAVGRMATFIQASSKRRDKLKQFQKTKNNSVQSIPDEDLENLF